MIEKNVRYAVLFAAALVLIGCAQGPESDLTFDAHISISGSQQTVMTMEVRNEGQATFRGQHGFDGQIQVWDGNVLHACVEAPELVGPLEPGESHFPAGWRGVLPEGTYQVRWGSPGEGGIVADFAIVEQDGRGYLDTVSLETLPTGSFVRVDDCEEYIGWQSARDDATPPAATLSVGDQQQSAGIGTYCWPDPAAGLAVCADTIGIPTAQDPLIAESPLSANLILPVEESPDILTLTVLPVTQDDELDLTVTEWRWWEYSQGEGYSLSLDSQQEIELELEPGLYVLSVFVQWEDLGDVMYGFLVDVR
jgi:hypothetical protein